MCDAQVVARSADSIDMEACFSQLTLDVIGKAVFNYDFDALTTSSPVIQVRLAGSLHRILHHHLTVPVYMLHL